MIIVDDLSLSNEQKTKRWYSERENDLFKACLHQHIREVHSKLTNHRAFIFIDEQGNTINAAAILGLERYLSPELTAEYRERRLALERAVLEEHRWHRASQIPHSARLALVSAQNSLWARERARAAALYLEQDVQEMDLQTTSCSRRCSMSNLNGASADATKEERNGNGYHY